MTRREAREQALCLVFEETFQEAPLDDILKFAAQARDLVPDPFAERLAQGVFAHKEEIDAKIGAFSIGWKIDRLSRVVLTVLRIAVYELLYEPQTPESIVINEAVELAKTYGAPADGGYVNGVLGALVRAGKADAT